MSTLEGKLVANNMKVGIVVARFNEFITNKLLGGAMDGLDALLATVQMPSGIPVATVAINGGVNAGLLAAKILATSDPELLARLKAYSEDLKNQVEKKDARLKEVGYKNY